MNKSKSELDRACEELRKRMSGQRNSSTLQWDDREVWEGVRDKCSTRLVIKR